MGLGSPTASASRKERVWAKRHGTPAADVSDHHNGRPDDHLGAETILTWPADPRPLVWDKNNAGRDFADFEMAWSNLDMVARRYVFRPMGMDGGKVHPPRSPSPSWNGASASFPTP